MVKRMDAIGLEESGKSERRFRSTEISSNT